MIFEMPSKPEKYILMLKAYRDAGQMREVGVDDLALLLRQLSRESRQMLLLALAQQEEEDLRALAL